MRRDVYGVLLAVLMVSPVAAREWSDGSGQRVEAEFVSLEGETAYFRLPSGEVRRSEVGRLSQEDQQYLASLETLFTKQVGAAVAKEVATLVSQQTVTQLTAAKTAETVVAGDCGPCQPAPQQIECTVMVPQMVTEMRTINCTQWRAETRQSKYMVYRRVPETRSVPYEYTVPTYETREREFVYTVCKPVLSTEQREYTVMVPHAEQRQGTRQVCRMVPVTMSRTVCEDRGSWQQRVFHSGCNCCCTCETVCNVWVPNWQTREVQYTVMRPQMETVPYTYTATVCKPEKRVQNVQVCNYVTEQQKRSVPYTVCVPVKKTGTREITTCRVVPEEQTCNYTVQVPYTVAKQVPVQVCKMVAKKITVPACQPGCWNGGWRGGCCW